MRYQRVVLYLIGLLIIQVLGTNCGNSPPARFYTLRSIDNRGVNISPPLSERRVYIGIGPIEIPDYLDRPQLINRIGENEFQIDEFNRWAGSLRDDIERVLTENISLLLSNSQISVSNTPWDPGTDYQVKVDIMRFDIMPNNVQLRAKWNFFDKQKKSIVIIKDSEFSQPIHGEDYDEKTAAMSQALENLSMEIADAIRPLTTPNQTIDQ